MKSLCFSMFVSFIVFFNVNTYTFKCFNINTINNKCIFYDGKCKIYNNRPYDCRLYPYDIKKINEKFFLVLYKLDCIEYENFFEDVDFLIKKSNHLSIYLLT